MTRSKTVPASHWSVRVTRMLPEVRLALKDISGVAIGEHPKDQGCSRSHYHIYFRDIEIKSPEKFTTYFKSLIPDCTLKGNTDFCITNTETFDGWYQYVYGGPKEEREWRFPIREILFNLPETERPYPLPLIRDITDLVLPATNVIIPGPKKVPNKKKAMRVQFIEHLQSQGWKKDERFFENSFNSEAAVNAIAEEMTDFWENAFTIPEGQRMARHALFVFSDEGVKGMLRRNNARAFYKNIFCD